MLSAESLHVKGGEGSFPVRLQPSVGCLCRIGCTQRPLYAHSSLTAARRIIGTPRLPQLEGWVGSTVDNTRENCTPSFVPRPEETILHPRLVREPIASQRLIAQINYNTGYRISPGILRCYT